MGIRMEVKLTDGYQQRFTSACLAQIGSEAITAGADVYWDNTNGVITATAESNILAGYAIADAAAADAVVSIKINA